MKTATHPGPATLAHLEKKAPSLAPAGFVPLQFETRTHVDSATAAYHLMRRLLISAHRGRHFRLIVDAVSA